MIQFQLKPRLTQNLSFVSPLRVFLLRLSLQCAGLVSAHALHNMRVLFFAPMSIVVLTIGLLSHSYLSTFLYLIQVASPSTCFCAEHHLHA